MSKTTNYQLTLWDYADEDFTPKQAREDLAANFTALDAALKAEEAARQSAVNTLNAALAGKAAIVTGSYIGDGENIRIIQLGFTPRLVFVITNAAQLQGGVYIYGGMALQGQDGLAVAVIEKGFTVRCHSDNQELFSNGKSYKYFYWALQ